MQVNRIEAPRDGVDVEELATLHHEEFGRGREFDRDAVSKSVYRCIVDKERKHINCWVVYDNDGNAIGYLAAAIHGSFYSHRNYAVQEMWYVVPKYRGSRAGAMLVREFEFWAHQHNAERIYMQVEHDADAETVKRVFGMMNRLGYNIQGYIGVKVINQQEKEVDDDRSTHRAVGAQQA